MIIVLRDHEIIYSKGVIVVHYQGRKVWLEELNSDHAMVSFIENPGRKMQVRIGDLVEQ